MKVRQVLPWLLAAVLVVLGLGVASVRELSALGALADVGRGSVARYVAAAHAHAAHGAMVWALAVAGVMALPGGWAERRRPGREAWMVAGALAGVATLAGLPRVGLAAVGVLGAATVSRPARAFAAVAACLVAAWCAAEGGLARTLAPDDAAALVRLGPVWVARWAVVGIGAGWLLERALRGGWRWGPALGLGATVGSGVLTWGSAAAAVLDWGPTEALGALASGSLVVAPTAERFVGGCVWTPANGGWDRLMLGHESPRHGIEACPDSASPVLEDRPTLRLGADTPVEELVALGVGEAHLLGTIGSQTVPPGLEPWRWGVLVVQHLDPDVLRWRPLPSPVLVPAGTEPGDLPDLLRGAPLRVDVVFLSGRGFTLGSVAALCGAAREAHPLGVRCAVGAGPGERW